MRVMLVIDHPYGADTWDNTPHHRSFTAAMAHSAGEGLGQARHNVDLVGLHAQDLNPVMSEQDLVAWRSGRRSSDPVVADYQSPLLAAGHLVLGLPNWWGAMAAKGQWSMTSLLLWATLGNTLGSMSTWWLGWLATFKKKPEDFQGRGEQKALGWLKQHGHWCLLLAWTPVVGDGLCLLAGWLRLSFWRSLILIGLGKLFRYALVFLLASHIF